MVIKKIGNIHTGQDGAVWKNFLFRLDADGKCYVYDLTQQNGCNEWTLLSEFQLGSCDQITPHSNSVTFSCEKFCDSDEFPLLFSNVYNNYEKQKNRHEGVCCVYRIKRQDTAFSADLIATVEVAFSKDETLWCSPNRKDVRPYGNFVVDRPGKKLFVFTMRDESQTTRYFCFPLPEIAKAQAANATSLKRIILKKTDVIYYFDCPYHHFIQGGCVKDHKIYSLEGFTNNPGTPPALRIISTENGKQDSYILFNDYGLSNEPEMIDFVGDICHYCDHAGNVYTIDFSL